jgi:hypothetical protein
MEGTALKSALPTTHSGLLYKQGNDQKSLEIESYLVR